MNLIPKIYIQDVTKITIEILNKHDIKGLILDTDNTLIDYDKKLDEKIVKWCEDLKAQGIKMCILSNTNKVEKVKKVAKTLNLEYNYFAKKPSKKGFLKAQEMLKLEPKNIAVVGDQVFTDVLGGNRSNMFTILTVPLDKRDIFITKIKRPFEKIIKKKLKLLENR